MNGLVGRGDDLAVLEGFLDRGPSPGARALVLEGPPGIGKTRLLSAGIERARRRGFLVLATHPAEADAGLEYLGLADLLENVSAEMLERLPTPQRSALEAAITGGELVLGPRAIQPALRTVLAALAAASGVLLAVDDVQWLDRGTDAALAFALRRLLDQEVRVLLVRRHGTEGRAPRSVEWALEAERLTVGPLNFEQTLQLLHERLGVPLARREARRVWQVSAGNPLYALELGRMLSTGENSGAEAMRIPDRLEGLIDNRIGMLAPQARQALLAVGLAGELSVAEAEAVVGAEALSQAQAAEAIRIDAGHVRAAHPLFAEVVCHRASVVELRELHRSLASNLAETERRTLHLAQATSPPNESVASVAAATATSAANQGKARTAALLSSQALRLTEPGEPIYGERVLLAAQHLWSSAQLSRAAELIESNLGRLSNPDQRAYARSLLVDCDAVPIEQAQAQRELALAELGDSSPALRSRILAAMSSFRSIMEVSSIADAERLAQEANAAASASGEQNSIEEAWAAWLWALAMRGTMTREHLANHGEHVAPEVSMFDGTGRSEVVWLMWRGDLAAARERLTTLRAMAEQRGEEESCVALRLQACELELRAANWNLVESMIAEWACELPVVAHAPAYLTRCQALLAAGRGDAALARGYAREALDPANGAGTWNDLESHRALGASALLAGEPDQAVGPLQQAWEHTAAAGVGNLGTFPVGPDLAEALSLCGRRVEAEAVAATLARCALEQQHPWAAAAADRAWGHVLLAAGDHQPAVVRFVNAHDRFAAIGMPLDAARSMMALGTSQRRARALREARVALERAAAEFDAIGSLGWAALARLELARVGGRRRGGEDVLTATERQVAQLVQEGLANKQIAQRLVVSTSTVEAHLTRIYRKLGVASRTELARMLAEQSVGISPIPGGDAHP